MCDLRVNEDEITSRYAFVINILVLGCIKELKMTKEPFFSESPWCLDLFPNF